MSLEFYAEEVAANIPLDNDLPQISPLIISLIIEALYYLAKKCLLDKKTVNSPGLLERFMLRYYCRVACGGEYRKESRKIADGLLKTGLTATQKDLDNLLVSIYQEKIKRGE